MRDVKREAVLGMAMLAVMAASEPSWAAEAGSSAKPVFVPDAPLPKEPKLPVAPATAEKAAPAAAASSASRHKDPGSAQPKPAADTASTVAPLAEPEARDGDDAADAELPSAQVQRQPKAPRKAAKAAANPETPTPPSLTFEALRDEIATSPAELEKSNLLKERQHLGDLAGALDTAQKQLRKDTERLAAYLEEARKQNHGEKQSKEAAQKAAEEAAAKQKNTTPTPAGPSPLEVLSKAMRGMKPAQAAAIAERVPLTLAADVLQKMPARDAGRVMGLMNPARAAELASEIASRDEVRKRAGR